MTATVDILLIWLTENLGGMDLLFGD